MGAHWRTQACKIVPITVSNALQRIYHEIESQFFFLNFKAGFGG